MSITNPDPFLTAIKLINSLLLDGTKTNNTCLCADAKRALLSTSLSEKLSFFRNHDLSEFVFTKERISQIAFDVASVLCLFCGEHSYDDQELGRMLDLPLSSDELSVLFPGLAKHFMGDVNIQATLEIITVTTCDFRHSKSETYHKLCETYYQLLHSKSCSLQDYISFLIEFFYYYNFYQIEPGFYVFYGYIYDLLKESLIDRKNVLNNIFGVIFDDTRKYLILQRNSSTQLNLISCNSTSWFINPKEAINLIIAQLKLQTDIETFPEQWIYVTAEHTVTDIAHLLYIYLTKEQLSQISLTNNIMLFDITSAHLSETSNSKLYFILKKIDIILQTISPDYNEK